MNIMEQNFNNVLGQAMLGYGWRLDEIHRGLNNDLMRNEGLRWVGKAILELNSEGIQGNKKLSIDLISVYERLKRMDKLDDIGGLPGLSLLVDRAELRCPHCNKPIGVGSS